jgi:hypothetical protein
MNSQTGRWLDVRAADLRAADLLARASFPTAIKNVCDKLRTTLFCLAYEMKSAVDARVAGCIIA